MQQTLLKTGEVAEILGVSRQHVVNLADRGELLAIMVGAHRRIPLSEVDRLRGPTRLTSEQVKSLRLHQALIGDLLADPEGVIAKARDNIDKWLPQQRADGMTALYLHQWEEILDAGVDRIIDALTSTDEQACELRENSPFAGVLTQERRSRVLATVRERQRESAR